jgi:hypothetical protein
MAWLLILANVLLGSFVFERAHEPAISMAHFCIEENEAAPIRINVLI